MKVPSAQSPRAFTLIELLVVISIIAILMTLLFPAVSSAIYTARKTQAKNDATQIATAIIAYNTEYGKMPTDGTSDITASQETGKIMEALCPSDPNSPDQDLNPRGITFLEIPNAQKSKKNGRVGPNQPYLDPWGEAYFVSIDGDYDGQVEGPSGDSQSTKIRKTAIVWSKGDIKSRPKDADDPTKWVKSWE